MAESWGSWGIRWPGPPEKTGAPGAVANRIAGAVVHSAEGSLDAALSVLGGPTRSSWHLTIAKDGRYVQHYPLEAVTWHAGADANPRLVGIELEGVAGEELTGAQFDCLVNVLRWIGAVGSWATFERHVTLFEHNEFMATACPSGRVPWGPLIEALAGPLPPALIDLLRGLTAAAHFARMGWNLRDLSEQDKAAVRWIAAQL